MPTAPGIRWRSVAVGGLAAGLVLNFSGMASAVALDLGSALGRLGWEPAPWTFGFHLGLRFLLGGVCVLLYAAFVPRFGVGTRSMLAAALVLWLAAYANFTLLLGELGAFEGLVVLAALAWGLAESVLATAVGSRFYRDPPTHSTPGTP